MPSPLSLPLVYLGERQQRAAAAASRQPQPARDVSWVSLGFVSRAARRYLAARSLALPAADADANSTDVCLLLTCSVLGCRRRSPQVRRRARMQLSRRAQPAGRCIHAIGYSAQEAHDFQLRPAPADLPLPLPLTLSFAPLVRRHKSNNNSSKERAAAFAALGPRFCGLCLRASAPLRAPSDGDGDLCARLT